MKNKQAISLIVLVITIIVMIVLAGAIILTLNNSGIINKASEAVQKSDDATLQAIANLAWAEKYAENATSKNKLTGDALILALEDRVREALRANGITPEEYGIIATTNGVKIAKGWLQDGTVVANGKYRLNVGDDIVYDETFNGTVSVPKNVSWKVLGVSDNGELLIISSELVTNYTFGSIYERDGIDDEDIIRECQREWLTIADALDKSCEKYGKGEGAIAVRSVTKDDIDRITKINKSDYGKNTITEYGNKVTYSYDGSKIIYSSTNGVNGTMNVPELGFHYYNGKEFAVADLSKGPCEITSTTSNYYEYDENLMLELHIKLPSKAYDLIDIGNTYWLASPYAMAGENGFEYGISRLDRYGPEEIPWSTWSSSGTGTGSSLITGVRAVVTLSTDINLTGSSDTEWTY